MLIIIKAVFCPHSSEIEYDLELDTVILDYWSHFKKKPINYPFYLLLEVGFCLLSISEERNETLDPVFLKGGHYERPLSNKQEKFIKQARSLLGWKRLRKNVDLDR